MHFFEMWWKISSYSLDDNCPLTEKHVSKFRGDLNKLPAKQLTVNARDYKGITNELKYMMPKVYLKMLRVKEEIR